MSGSSLSDLAAEGRDGAVHLPAEILKQPGAWRDTVAALKSAGQVGEGFVVLSGAGSSLNVCALTAELLRKERGAAVRAVSGTDILHDPAAYLPKGDGTLISLSRSGGSPEVVEAARRVGIMLPNVTHAAVTCKAGSDLAKWMGEDPRRKLCLLDPDFYDRALATTVSMTAMTVAALAVTSPALMGRVGDAAAACEGLLETSAGAAREVAARKPERVVFLGTGVHEAAAMEGALKILEMTDGKVATLSRNFLEFRHGPIAFLNDRTTLVCIESSDDSVRPYERDFVKQMREAGAAGQLVVLGPEKDADVALPDLGGLEALLAVAFAQMTGLFLSLEYGLTPDRPGGRGLVNPVVQGVTIYQDV